MDVSNFAFCDQLIDAVVVCDRDKRIIYANLAFATMANTSLKRIKPLSPVYEILHFSDPHIFLNLDIAWPLNTDHLNRETDFITKKGESGRVMVSTSKLPDENFIVFFKDLNLEIKLQTKYQQELDEKQAYIAQLKTAQDELKKYSENLEKIVEERTKELMDTNRFIKLMINSLDVGLIAIDVNGECLDGHSKMAEIIFEMPLKKSKLWNVLRVAESEVAQTKKWLEISFQELLPFHEMVDLMPRLININGKQIGLEYYPMRDSNEKIQSIILLARDKTIEFKATQAAKEKTELVSRILRFLKSSQNYKTYIDECSDQINQVEQLCKMKSTDWDTILRLFHSIKGSSQLFSFNDVAECAHICEELSIGIRDGEESFWPQLDERIMELKNKFHSTHKETLQVLSIPETLTHRSYKLSTVDSFFNALKNEIKNEEIINLFFNYFMQDSLHETLSQFQIALDDTCHQLSKQCNPMKITGADVYLKSSDYSGFFSNLVHIFRNIGDHGLEAAGEREIIGKNASGNVIVNTEHDGINLIITVSDDGRGIDPQRIRQKLSEKNIPHEHMNNEIVIQQIFNGDLSTKEEVTNISGRGVGLSGLKEEVEKLKGSISVKSMLGKGSVFKMVIPTPHLKKSVHQ
jgi:two-component system chemotaxis sensor kinase CheA